MATRDITITLCSTVGWRARPWIRLGWVLHWLGLYAWRDACGRRALAYISVKVV